MNSSDLFYKLMQARNLLLNQLDFGNSLSWVYIYGLHRGGSTYALNQFMKVSRRGCGDWMLFEFAEPFKKAKNRQRSKLNMNSMFTHFRKNLLRNANVGGGTSIDIIIKQATGRKIEVDFLSEIFKSAPKEKVFVYREPHGWWLSAKKKFNFSDEEMLINYRNGLSSFFEIGGTPICYGQNMPNNLAEIPSLSRVSKMDDFFCKEVTRVPEAVELENDFKNFVSKVNSELFCKL